MQVFTYTDTSAGGLLHAGVYSQTHASYTGGTSNGVTFTPADSRVQNLPDVQFQVLPVRS